MADDQKPEHDDKHHEVKSDMHKLQEKYEEMKNDPKVKATQSLFASYFIEIFYVVAVAISFIYSLIKAPRGAVIFTGVGFLLGLFLFSFMKNTAHSMSAFLHKQELVVHIILAIIIIILAFIVPTIMMGILIGIPGGIAVRCGVFSMKGKDKTPPHE